MRYVFALCMLLIQAAMAAPPVYAPVTAQRTLAFPADFGAHPDHRLHDHVPEQVQPETAAMIGRQWPEALITGDGPGQKCGIVETGEQ